MSSAICLWFTFRKEKNRRHEVETLQSTLHKYFHTSVIIHVDVGPTTLLIGIAFLHIMLYLSVDYSTFLGTWWNNSQKMTKFSRDCKVHILTNSFMIRDGSRVSFWEEKFESVLNRWLVFTCRYPQNSLKMSLPFFKIYFGRGNFPFPPLWIRHGSWLARAPVYCI